MAVQQYIVYRPALRHKLYQGNQIPEVIGCAYNPMYEHYRGLSRYYGVENFHLYINDENNARLVRQVVNAMRDVAEALSYDDSAVAREMAKFVQDCIVYEYDSDTTGQDEFPRYPIETLYERRGDCEDTSILMAALLKAISAG